MERRRRKQVTMADVAAAAGVSVTTVSHVVNRTASISDETAERVRQAVARLGYRAKPAAEMNLGQRIIGVFTPEISNEFYARAVQAIFDEAWGHDYAVMICSTRHQHRAEAGNIRSLLQCGIKGLVFFGGASDDERLILNASKRLPVVLGDRRLPSVPVDTVGTDNADVMRRLIARLVKSGYSRIGYVSEDLIMSNCCDRFSGYRQGLAENRLRFNKEWVFLEPELRLDKLEGAYRLFSANLERGASLPQVFLCSSDLIAIGLIAALRAHGHRVPEDIGVVGFDNVTVAAYADPPLTTVAQDMRQFGRVCFRVLQGRMENQSDTPQETILRNKIIVRKSVRL